MQTRCEKDLLGEKQIDDSKYYGIHTLRAVENFPISGQSIGMNTALVKAMAQVKKASALANQEMQVLNPLIAEQIIQACDEIISHPEKWGSSFPSDVYQGGAGTSVNMNANEVIANLALEKMGHPKGSYQFIHPNDHVNKCQSTNDFYPTALRLALYVQMENSLRALQVLASALQEKATEFADVVKMGRTQLQDAVPMSLGQEFQSFASLIKAEIQSCRWVQGLLLNVHMGGTAIGNGVNTPQGYRPVVVKHLAQVTGLSFQAAEDAIASTSDCGDFVALSGALKKGAVRLSKICSDLRLMSSGPRAGIKEINLPEMQAGSSIMPAKVNPVIPEVVNQVCFRIIGNDLTVTMAAEAGQLQLNVMEPVIAQALFEGLQLFENATMVLAEKCVQGITANKERCREQVLSSVGIITLLEPLIGHAHADDIGKECARTGRSVSEVVLEKGLVTKEVLDKVFSNENLINPQLAILK